MAEWAANGFAVEKPYDSVGDVGFGAVYSFVAVLCTLYQGYPDIGDVRDGTVYGHADQLEGTMTAGGGETSHVF